MTEVLVRSPLQTLTMSSTQRPARRRSARLAFDEEDTRPTKKAKMVEEGSNGIANGNAKAVTRKRSVAAGKKAKPGMFFVYLELSGDDDRPPFARLGSYEITVGIEISTNMYSAYDENADGFQFSRTGSKKATPKESAPSEAVLDRSGHVSASAAPPRKKTTTSEPAATADIPPRKTRKSARLSADGEQIQAPTRSKTPARHETEPPRPEQRTERAKTPGAVEESLQLEKKRGPTKIALPFADTPVISRNKEMRKNSAQGSRRSSSSMRGRRASSLIDSGTSNGEHSEDVLSEGVEDINMVSAMPHSEVPTAEFYKHISQDLPEPRRMQQLLSWCATRALPERPSGTSENVNAILAGR